MKAIETQDAPAPTYVWTADARIIRVAVRRVS